MECSPADSAMPQECCYGWRRTWCARTDDGHGWYLAARGGRRSKGAPSFHTCVVRFQRVSRQRTRVHTLAIEPRSVQVSRRVFKRQREHSAHGLQSLSPTQAERKQIGDEQARVVDA